jgi:hypothetical protein
VQTLRWLGLGAVTLLAASCADRWAGLPSSYYDEGDLRVQVKNIRTAPMEYDLSAGPTNFLIFSDDPLRIKLPLEIASKKEAAVLCAPMKPEVVTEAQQPPAVALFTHIVCR